MNLSVRRVFHGERVVDSFNMVTSGMKTTFCILYQFMKSIPTDWSILPKYSKKFTFREDNFVV